MHRVKFQTDYFSVFSLTARRLVGKPRSVTVRTWKQLRAVSEIGGKYLTENQKSDDCVIGVVWNIIPCLVHIFIAVDYLEWQWKIHWSKNIRIIVIQSLHSPSSVLLFPACLKLVPKATSEVNFDWSELLGNPYSYSLHKTSNIGNH